MTQKTTTLAEKFESIKAALENVSRLHDAIDNHTKESLYQWVHVVGRDAKAALATLQELEKDIASEEMKKMGMLNVLCECHVFAPDDERESIISAVLDNLPKGWQVKRLLSRIELMPPHG